MRRALCAMGDTRVLTRRRRDKGHQQARTGARRDRPPVKRGLPRRGRVLRRIVGTCTKAARRGPSVWPRLRLPASTDNCTDSARRRARGRPAPGRRAPRQADGAAGAGKATRRWTARRDSARRSAAPPASGNSATRYCARASRCGSSLPAAPARTSAAHPACAWRSAWAGRGRPPHSWSEKHARRFSCPPSRPPQPRQPLHQRSGRVERRARKRPEAGDEDGGHGWILS